MNQASSRRFRMYIPSEQVNLFRLWLKRFQSVKIALASYKIYGKFVLFVVRRFRMNQSKGMILFIPLMAYLKNSLNLIIMEPFKLDRNSFQILSFEEADKELNDHSSMDWKQRLILHQY